MIIHDRERFYQIEAAVLNAYHNQPALKLCKPMLREIAGRYRVPVKLLYRLHKRFSANQQKTSFTLDDIESIASLDRARDYLTGIPRHKGSVNYVDSRKQNRNRRLSDSVWRKVREQVFRRDKYTCQYCGAKARKLHCDHIYPLSRGGSNEMRNLVTACQRCNQSKHDKTISEWRPALLSKFTQES